MKLKISVLLIFSIWSMCLTAGERTKHEKLNELVGIMGTDSMIQSMHSKMEAVMQNMSTKLKIQPNEQAMFDKYQAQMVRVMKEDMSWEKIEPLIVDVYSRNFTEREVDDILAFYKTKTGKSLLKKMPSVTQDSMQISQKLLQRSMSKIQKITKNLGEELSESRKGG